MSDGTLPEQIRAELEAVARRVAKRVADSPYSREADSHVIRSAIYTVFFYENPKLDATLGEIERLARARLAELIADA